MASLIAAARRSVAWLRGPRRARRFAQVLWVAWAVIVWNVVFDHVIVVAGRAYLAAAGPTVKGSGPYVQMDAWMRPAVVQGLWTATASAVAILLVGLVGIQWSVRPARDGAPRSTDAD